MKFLVVGLGSMGKRRIRNLHTLKFSQIAGFDSRNDRVEEAVKKYQITPFSDFNQAIKEYCPDAIIISTGPRYHMHYAYSALKMGLSCFIEASVVEAEKILELHQRIKHTNIIMAPSCTMRFSAGPKKIKELIHSKVIGKPLNYNYHCGQWLPDWHPWEDVREFYVSDYDTGGCKEIVPFELTWLNDVFGEPEPLACVKAKLSEMPIDIDDIYHCLLSYPNGIIGNLTVEILSRPVACREFRLIGSEGEIVFNDDENCVRYATVNKPEWKRFELGESTIEAGYINPEEPYVEEMGLFVEALKNRNPSIFPNSLKDDFNVLQTLFRLEQLAGESK